MATVNGAAVATVTAKASGAPVKLVAGFPNHNLNVKVELLLNDTWTDITRYVLVRDDLTISPFGRTDESSQMDSSSMSLTLRNADGRFTPDNTSGAYYPYVQLNTQIRVSVIDTSVTGVTYQGYRFWGEVSEWPPQWDVTGRDVYCQITASGIWRRLSQRTKTLGSPYTRFNNQLNSAYNLAAYWPMEDGTGSQYFATTTPSTAANMIVVGAAQPTLASVTSFAGSDALPTLNQSELSGTITTSQSPTTVQFRFCMFFPAGGDTGAPGNVALARLHLAGGISNVDVMLGPAGGGPLVIKGSNSGGSTLFTGSSTLNIWGIPMMVLVNLTQQGSNVLWTMNTILPGGTSWNTTVVGTAASTTVSDATSVIFSPGSNWGNACVGQAAVYYGNPPILSTADALNGWAGERAMNRFTRICAEEGVPAETIGSSATTMGGQADDTLANILQEIETTDGGMLYETRDQFGLGYRSMASLQNQSVAGTLDYAQNQVGQPLQPVIDDAMIHNDITLTSNYDGYSVRVYLANGARSLQNPPNGIGSGYEQSITVNSTNHTQVNNLGIQLLNNGTFSGSRYPTITANMARTTLGNLFNVIPSLRQGDYLQVTNLPAFGGPATQKQLVWGWTETINNKTWTLAFNTVPEATWESSFNPGSSVSSTVPAVPTTQGGAGGTAGTVTSAMIVEGAIIGQNIATGAVQGGNIAAGTITATNIGTGQITGTLIGTGTITAANIQNATITSTQISGTANITGGQIATATISGSNIVAGTITGGVGGNIASASIAGSNIVAGTITGGVGGNIASATITATNITNASITSTQISGSAGITGSQLANGTITATQIQSATITSSQISASAGITGSQIAGGTIQASNIQNATITNVQIAAGSITGGAGGNIGGSTITGANMQNATITSVQIQNGTITTTQISNSAAITGTQIASGTIVTGNIAANAVTSTQIAANAVTATQIAANTITAGKLVGGIVVAGIVDATTITGANLVLNGAAGQILIYSGTPASGNLIGSWSGVSGTDAQGNVYPAGLSVQQGVITGLGIDSVTITNATLQGDILNGSSIAQPVISGGSITETNVTFDSTGGQLLVYTSSTTTVTQSTAGNYTWTVPSGVTSAKVECWGAGAGGNGGSTSVGGNGGGAGEYATEANYGVTPAATIHYTVGAGGVGASTGGSAGTDGGSTFFDNNGVYANGGNGDTTGGSGSANTLHNNGGSGGGAGSNAGGASGGNSGNATAAGNNGNASSGTTGGAAPTAQTGSGRGGAGGNSGANGSNGSSPGAGGGGAGKGSSTGTQTITYAPVWTGSYYGSDATGHTPSGLRSTSTLYQGGETASGGTANGNQYSIFAFNRTQIASDFSGYTVTSCQLQLKNLHSWYSSGIYIAIDEYTGLPGSVPSTAPNGDYFTSPATVHSGEGEEHNFGLAASVGQRFVSSTSNGLGFGFLTSANFAYNLGYYGYFDASQVRFTITGTTTSAGSQTAGNAADGQVKITYTTGQNLLAAIAPASGSDSAGNAFAAGYTGPVNVIQPGSSPAAVESWHNLTLLNGWATQSGSANGAQYKMVGYNLMLVRMQIKDNSATSGTFANVPTGYGGPSVSQFFPLNTLSGAAAIIQLGTGAGASMQIVSWSKLNTQYPALFLVTLD